MPAGYLPPGLFYELFKWSHENHISYKQLELEIIRQFLGEKRGWSCPHDPKDRKFSRKTKQAYCRNCYSFFDRVFVKGKIEFIVRKPIWDSPQTMTVEQWSRQIAPENKDMK